MTKRVILVTGGAGYIGSQFIRDLAADPRFAGFTVRIYDNLLRNHLFGLMDLPKGDYEFVEGDILDRLNLHRAMQDAGAVVHLAAIVRTPMSFDHPAWTQQINHWGTASVVECALSANVPRLVYASSSSVYGPGGPFREADPCHPLGPYAISKLRGEGEVQQGAKRGLEMVILRLGTVFGSAPAMRFDGVANHFAYLAGVGRSITVHGNGEQVRPLIHVQDASAALRLALADPSANAEIFNVATMNISVNEMAETVRQIAPGVEVRRTEQDVLTRVSFRVHKDKLLGLGFEPRFDLRDGLREMLARLQHVNAMPPGLSLMED